MIKKALGGIPWQSSGWSLALSLLEARFNPWSGNSDLKKKKRLLGIGLSPPWGEGGAYFYGGCWHLVRQKHTVVTITDGSPNTCRRVWTEIEKLKGIKTQSSATLGFQHFLLFWLSVCWLPPVGALEED